jgi:hypothetical protein
MESYGLKWNDETASELETYYSQECCENLYKLISYLNLEPDKQLLAKSIMDNSESYEEKFNSLRYKVFNPLSNTASAQAPFWESYKTNYSTALSVLYYLDVNINKSSKIPTSVLNLIDKNDTYKTLDNLYSYEVDIIVKKYINNILNEMPKELDGWFTRFAAEVIEFQYNAHVKYGNAVIDDPSTWSREFEMIYYLRRFKKVFKSKSVYINGKVGRNTVFKARIDDPSKPPRRIIDYWSGHDCPLKDNESWIMNIDFFENGAETRRWRAGIHTVPWKSCDENSLVKMSGNGYKFIKDILPGESVKSLDLISNTIVDSVVTENRITGYNNVIEIELESGKVIKCTLDHKFLLSDGSYVEAHRLSEGDDLMEISSEN